MVKMHEEDEENPDAFDQGYASSEGDWALFIRTATQNPPAFLRAPLVKLLTNGDF